MDNQNTALNTKKKASFTGSLGFVLAAAGSAVGLGNIWRFPYLAAKHGGGLFILVYIILALTFGFALLTTDIAIGRKTGKSALQAYGALSKKWGFLGALSFIVPAIILTYYSVVGGWITKYAADYIINDTSVMAKDGYFTSFITSNISPIVFTFIFLAVTAVIVFFGVEKGIEKFSKFVMPGLLVLIIGIAIFSLTLSHTENGVTRNGLDGLARYFVPDFSKVTLSSFFQLLLDATGQLFYSLSVAMGIMITYGSYVKKDVNLSKSVSQIEIFDTAVAILSGLMIVPTVFIFSGEAGLENSGAGLMFVALPKVFEAMGVIGKYVGITFFIMVIFAALTSSVSIMETIVASCMGFFKTTRKKTSLIIAAIFATASVVICLGYNVLYFELTLPNGAVGQLLDVMDYLSNSVLMPIISLLTCILIGWILKPKSIIEEMEVGGVRFKKKTLYIAIVKYIAPVMLALILAQALGITNLLLK
ncbi:MAG: sodium-dependent transporter [Ruminococcaceae bacterium]|nr:sodium-dependent transporter [Oscillospiraceae bacterium]